MVVCGGVGDIGWDCVGEPEVVYWEWEEVISNV